MKDKKRVLEDLHLPSEMGLITRKEMNCNRMQTPQTITHGSLGKTDWSNPALSLNKWPKPKPNTANLNNGVSIIMV